MALVKFVFMMQRKPEAYSDGIFPCGFLEIFAEGKGSFGNLIPQKPEQEERVQLLRDNGMHFHSPFLLAAISFMCKD